MSHLIGLFLAVCALLGLAMLFYRQFRYSPEEGLALAMLTVMLTVYATGLLGNAAVGFFLLAALSLVGALLTLFNRRVCRRGLCAVGPEEGSFLGFFSPAILLVLCFALLGVLLFTGMCFYNWDEFVHWGKAVRFMAETNRLPVGTDFDGYSYMQSATTYFHYFIARCTGFDESCLYVSNLLLWGGALALPFSGCTKKDAGRVFAFGLMVFLAMYALYEIPYYNIYTDQALAMWAGGLIAYWMRTENRPGKWALGAAALVCIAMMKPQAGLLLAVIVVLAVLAMLLADRKTRTDSAPMPGRKKLLLALALLAAICAPFLLNKLWHSFSPNEGFFYNIEHFLLRLSDRARLWTVLYACYQKVFVGVGSFAQISYYTAFVGTALLLFLGRRVLPAGSYRSRYSVSIALYLVGFFAYFAITVLTYILFLPASDGINATSMERYLSLYLMMGLVPVTLPFFLETGEERPVFKRALSTGVALALTALFAFGVDASFLYRTSGLKRWDDPYYRMYMQLRTGAEQVTEISGGAPLYFIDQSSDSAAAAAEYAFAKAWNRSSGAYRFTPEEDGAVATGLDAYPISQLPERLLNGDFAYLWVCASDAYLAGQFAELLGVGDLADGDLFAIRRDGGALTLERVARISADLASARAFEAAH